MHVASSTDGYYVMADPFTGTAADFLAGPFTSQQMADVKMDELRTRDTASTNGKLDINKLLGVYNGVAHGVMQDMMRGKRVLENNGDALHLSEQFSPANEAWKALDGAIAKLSTLDALFSEYTRS